MVGTLLGASGRALSFPLGVGGQGLATDDCERVNRPEILALARPTAAPVATAMAAISAFSSSRTMPADATRGDGAVDGT